MRYMMIVKANADTEAGVPPSRELVDAMGRFNEEMVRAGVLLDAGGLQPSSRGVRVLHSDGRRTVTDGPFTEAKELIAGFWIIQVKSHEEAIEWAKRVPAAHGKGDTEIELRPFFEIEDFPAESLPTDLTDEQMQLRYGVSREAR